MESNQVFEEAGRLASIGDRRAAIDLLESLLKTDGDNYRAWAMLGMEYFSTKQFEKSREALRRALSINKKGYGALVSLGMIERRNGEFRKANDLFFDALEVEPTGAWAANEVILNLVAMEEFSLARFVCEKLAAGGALAEDRARFLFAYINFFKKYLSNLLDFLRIDFEASDRALVDVVEKSKIGEAASLIRLGDGEGCFLSRRFFADNPEVMSKTHGYMLRTWFGDKVADEETLAGVQRDFEESINSADYVGLPRANRLMFELKNDSRGALGVAMVAKYVKEFSISSPNYVDASINERLTDKSYLIELLRGVGDLCTISPHRDFGEKLRAVCEIQSGYDVIIDAQADFFGIKKSNESAGHLANYRRILSDLDSLVRPGRLFLIAGGLLGKCYAGRVRQLGGVAIDIGAVADFLMGYPTRGHHYTLSGKNAL